MSRPRVQMPASQPDPGFKGAFASTFAGSPYRSSAGPPQLLLAALPLPVVPTLIACSLAPCVVPSWCPIHCVCLTTCKKVAPCCVHALLACPAQFGYRLKRLSKPAAAHNPCATPTVPAAGAGLDHATLCCVLCWCHAILVGRSSGVIVRRVRAPPDPNAAHT